MFTNEHFRLRDMFADEPDEYDEDEEEEEEGDGEEEEEEEDDDGGEKWYVR